MTNNKNKGRDILRGYIECFVLASLLVVAIGACNAYATAGIAASLCTIPVSVLNTSIGRSIATIGIIIIGIMASIGRVTWPQALVVGVGISVIFGAAAIAGMLALGQGHDCAYT